MAVSVRSFGTPHLHVTRTPLVGRNREIAEVRHLLLRADVPLLTLSGPGGVGKTRLARHVAAELADAFADGVRFVSLAATREPERVAPALAQALDVPEVGGRSPLDAVRAALHDKELLLVLDNFEHVVDAAPVVAELLTSCPELTVLATSRTLLRLSDERDYPVRPLAVPDTEHLPPLRELAEIEGVTLFVERASAVSPEFALTEENAAAVAEICARLDGLPLAIELAAARCRLMSPVSLAARLTSRLTLLTGGARDQPGRLRSLRDAIAWSHDLLSPAEQLLFRRLAVFVGGFTLDAAAWVSGIGSSASGEPDVGDLAASDNSGATSEVLDLVGGLVDQSLLAREDQQAGEPRFGLLETIREYALERLEQSGEKDAVMERHAVWFTALAEAGERQLQGCHQLAWLDRLEADHDNLRGALAWLLQQENAAQALRLAGALDRFWFHHSHWAEGRRWLERALAIGPATPSPERAKALAGAGHLSWALSDYATARTRLEESMSVSREVADDRGLAYAALCLAWPIFVQGDYAAAGALATESLVRFRALDDRWGIVAATCSLGNTMMDASRSRPLFEGSLASAREMGDVWGIARASLCLGELARAEGDYDGAAALYEEALRLSRLLSQRPRVPHLLYYKALFNLGQVAALRGDAHTGVEHLAEALALLEDLGDRRGQGLCLAGLATMASLLGQPERAARFFGAADALLSAAGVAMEPVDAAVCEPHRRATRSRLGAQAFADARDEGATLAPAAIIAEGLAFATEVRATCPSDAPPDAKTSLSSREMDVLRLLVEGHSNPEIATALFISHRTVRNHVTNILAKLDVESRTAAATLALREGLV